jgi:oligopeptidase A
MNPLLKKTDLPLFSAFKTEDVIPALDKVLDDCRRKRESLLKQETYAWENLIFPLDIEEDYLSQMFSPVSHLNSVCNTPELREVYQASIEKITEYSTEVGQHQGLYNAYKQISKSDKSLSLAQKKSLEDALKGFHLSGVDLPKEKREALKVLSAKLAKFQSDFENNVLDATMGWHYYTDNLEELAGLPQHVIDAAEAKARSHDKKAQDKKGYILGLDMPTYLTVLMSAENRSLREKMYEAFATRASDQGSNAGKWDNSALLVEIMQLRAEEAKILGFNNFAELSIDTKMAESTDAVLAFMYDLVKKSKPQAEMEYEELQLFATENGLVGALQSWDATYYSEKFKKSLFDFTQEELRPYFPVTQVMQGLFKILQHIYGLMVKEVAQIDKYHDDVKLYEFKDKQGNLRGKIFVDLYAREHKRGGAWMDECRVRYRKADGGIQSPVAYVTCNFTPALGDQEATLTHTDVVTLFHEFGHALHHVLTQVEDLPVSGINGVEWDAVELPSQFMENFCWTAEGLKLISSHIETGKPLPDVLFSKLNDSRKFQSALQMIRQLEFSIFDFKIHMLPKIKGVKDIQQVLDQTREEVSVSLPPSYNRFQHSFTHIFAGGYAAGYYSYKWAEVLSSDAFAKFEESGSVFNAEDGQAFLTCILEKGGSQPAAELFENFRGRKPSIDAILRHAGIR